MEQNVGNDEIKQDAEAHNLDTEKLVSFSYIVDDDHSRTTCNYRITCFKHYTGSILVQIILAQRFIMFFFPSTIREQNLN